MSSGKWNFLQPFSHGENLLEAAQKQIEKHIEERVANLTRELDDVIAQRDRAIAAVAAALGYTIRGPYGKSINLYMDAIRAVLANTPAPDRLAAEREAGRREGFEEAAKIAEIYDAQLGPEIADEIRALLDTPVAQENPT